MSLDLTIIAYPIVIAGPATVNAYPIALGAVADTGPEISISWPCCLRIGRKTPRTKARPTYNPSIVLPEGATLTISSTCSSRTAGSSTTETACYPGGLPVSAPLIPNLFVNDSDLSLIGSGREISDILPNWLATDECSVLHRVLNLFGKEMDRVRASVKSIVESNLFNPLTNEFRLHYSAYTSLDDNSYLEYYASGGWQPLYRCSSLEELKQAAGPCYWKSNNQLMFSNLEVLVATSSGSLVSPNYVHTLSSSIVEDKSCYAINSSYANLPNRRWREITPEELGRDSYTFTSTEQVLTVASYITPPSSGYIVRARSTDITRSFIVKPQDYVNSWDTLAGMSGLERVPGEGNLSLQDRIKTVRAFPLEGLATTNLSIARDLNLINIFEWDGESSINLGSLYPDFTDILIQGLSEDLVFIENLKPGPSGLFTSRNKEWEAGYRIYVNGLAWSGPYTFDEGVLTINTKGSVAAVYSVKAWKIISGVLTPTVNTVRKTYLVAVVNDTTVTSLGNEWATLFLDSSRKLTGEGKVILKKLNEENPVTYGNIRWGSSQGTFKELNLLPKYIPLSFED